MIGNDAAALSRLSVLQTPDEKAGYLNKLISLNSEAAATAVEGVLEDIFTVDGAYDRDQLRLLVLEGVIASGNRDLALLVVSDLEDDDNQALGLSLTAQLL